jgi:hypothetical protein
MNVPVHTSGQRGLSIFISKACAKNEEDKKVPYFIKEKFIAGNTELRKRKAAHKVSVSFFYSLSRITEMRHIPGA